MEKEAQDLLLSAVVCLLKAHEVMLSQVNALDELLDKDQIKILFQELFKVEAALSFLESKPEDQPKGFGDPLKLS